ncbi:MAG: sulfite exporter TauE/SafE family protein [Planctomycetota bacterium]|nr:sulfite exporter TauE/SafE family protein [Planctomycetota bacterium]
MTFDITALGIEINLLMIALGLFIGGLSSTFGVGGGFLLVPVLSLAFGVPAHIAKACSLAQMVPTSSFGLYGHFRRRNVVPWVAVVFFLGAAGGIELGAYLTELLKSEDLVFHMLGTQIAQGDVYLLAGLSVVFFLQGSFLIYETHRIPRKENGEPGTRFTGLLRLKTVPPLFKPSDGSFEPFPYINLVVLGFFAGIAIGFLGLGGGFVAVPILVYLVGLDTRKAVGTSLFLVLLAAIWGTYRHTAAGRLNVDWGITTSIVLGSFIGAQIGVWLNSVVKPANIRRYFGYIIFSMSVLVWVGFILRHLLA